MMRLVETVKHKLYPFVARYICNSTLVEGSLSEAGETVRCMFIDNSNYAAYMIARMFASPPRVVKKGKVLIQDLRRTLQRNADAADLYIAVLPDNCDNPLASMADFKGHPYIDQIIDTSKSWESIAQKFHDSKRKFSNRLERKSGMKCRISHDKEDFALFYRRMFLPLIEVQYAGQADIDLFEEMYEYFVKGFLLFVESGGDATAGALCVAENDTLIFRRSGVLDGREDLRKQGMQSALYYFIIRYALEHGIKRVDTMKSRPLLNDGVFVTKRRWGAGVLKDVEADTEVYYFIPQYSSKIAAFFAQNPMIVNKNGGLSALVGLGASQEPSGQLMRELTRSYYSSGLDKLLLLKPDSPDPIEYSFS